MRTEHSPRAQQGSLDGSVLARRQDAGQRRQGNDGDGDNDLVTEYGVVVLGDFTHDGNLDVATSQMSVLYGRGDGTFSTPEPTGSNFWGVAAGDFNGDGWLDAATTNQGGVSVLINDRSWPGPPASLTIRDVAVTEGHTGTVAASFVVTLSSNPTEPVTVNYTTADWSATTADGDYQSTSGTLTFNPGDPLTQTIPVLVNGDRRGEIGDTFLVIITSDDAPVIDGQGAGLILEDEPTVYIVDAPSVFEGNSGTTAMTFIVRLSAIYDVDIPVDFTTQDGSATSADGDYQATSGTATIAAGATTTTVTINVKGDEKVEADETFLVTLSGASSAYIPDYGQATGTIRNDDSLTKFYVVDASSDRTFEYSATGQAVENYPLGYGNNDPRGAASDASGQRVWVIDNDDYVDVYGPSGNSLGYWKAKGLSTPEGIASNGTDIWIVDRGQDRVYRYAGAATRTSGSASPTSSFALQVFQYTAAASRTSGSQSPSAVFNLAPGNTNPQGIADPPPPVGQASSLTTSAWKADLRTATVGSGSSVDVAALWPAAAEPLARGVMSRPSDETLLILPQRPRMSTASGTPSFALGETVSEVIRGRNRNEKDEYFCLNVFNAYDAVFADIERLNDILHDDRR